jgi:2-polyprenyl-3-methyl-5-hydroxy-6-metoxy-1,4-benzoquinol methylase
MADRATAVDPLELVEAYQRTAVVAAAVRTRVADLLAEESRSAEEVARACGLDPRGVRALLGALGALGLVHRNEGKFSLSKEGEVLARSHPETVALIVEKEWFFYQAWAGIEQTIRDGHARIAPWRERLARDPQQSLDFLGALDDLAARFGGELAELAMPLPSGRLLDVGGGAGSHAARLLAAGSGLEATVLDLPEAEPVLRERHPELRFVAGDLDQPRFGRPADENWDVVLIANVLHDHPVERARAILREAAALLAPGGVLLIYEWVLEEERDAPPAVAMFAVMMMIENEGGAAYTENDLREWVTAADLSDIEFRRGYGPIAVLRALKT